MGKILPISIRVLLVIVASTFFIDQFSSFYDAHWEIAELSFDDPTYLGMTIMWLCIVIWVCFDIIKRKKHIPSLLLTFTLVTAAFMIFELLKNEGSASIFISFQLLEVVFWGIAFYVAKYKVERDWFCQ